MKKIILFLLLIVLTSCTTTKYILVPFSKEPEFYEVPKENSITNTKQMAKEYQRSLLKITEWQNWFVVQTNNNNK